MDLTLISSLWLGSECIQVDMILLVFLIYPYMFLSWTYTGHSLPTVLQNRTHFKWLVTGNDSYSCFVACLPELQLHCLPCFLWSIFFVATLLKGKKVNLMLFSLCSWTQRPERALESEGGRVTKCGFVVFNQASLLPRCSLSALRSKTLMVSFSKGGPTGTRQRSTLMKSLERLVPNWG